MTFNPLATIKAIRNDKSLDKTQKALLVGAVLRTDNKTYKVKASLALIAEDMGYTSKSAERAFKTDGVLDYFSKVVRRSSRNGRTVDLWFTDDAEAISNGHTVGCATDTESTATDSLSTATDFESTATDTESEHLLLLSTLTSTSSSTTQTDPGGPVSLTVREEEEVKEIMEPPSNCETTTAALKVTEEEPTDTESVGVSEPTAYEIRRHNEGKCVGDNSCPLPHEELVW